MNDTELESKLRELAGGERAALAEFVRHLVETDRRRLYLRRAYRSLFAYLTGDFGLSPASAQRRIDAARSAAEMPELLEMLRTGEICLSRIGSLRRGIRFKAKKAEVTLRMKREALQRVLAAPADQADRIVAEYFAMPVVRRTLTQAQADASVRVSMTIPAEVWERLERCRDLLAHKIPDGQWPEVIGELCEQFLKKQDPERRAAASGAEVPREGKASGPIPAATRRHVFRRDKFCQYRDPATKRVCGSTFRLEIDHIRMRCRGGSNAPGNLRLLCRHHNQLVARDALGPAAGPSASRGRSFGKSPRGADPSP